VILIRPRPLDPPPRALLFDLDDTLCDYAGARAERLRRAFSLGLGLPASRDQHGAYLEEMIADSIEMHPHGADHFAALFARYGFREPGGAAKAAEWYRGNRFHGLGLFPDAAAVLRAVRRQGTAGAGGSRPVGIITNGPAEVQRAKVELLGVRDLVDFVIISGEFGIAKPDPAIFREALRQAGVRAEDAVFVGDSPEFDVAGAQGAGIPVVWVNPRGARWVGAQPPPDREIRSIAEFPGLLEPSPE
jgi:putative hydrolase of the HAD superfamily